MSLVHEALQKAEREKQRKAAAAPSTPVVAPATPLGRHEPISEPRVVQPLPSGPHELAPNSPAPEIEKASRANQFVLPVLIGCVAMVAMIAIVFLVISATSALQQSKETAPARAVLTPTARATTTPKPVPASVASAAETPKTVSSNPTPAGNETKYTLSGIMQDPDGKYVAVLNGRIAYEGDYIDGATVKKIDHDHATIEVSGRERELRLN
ncbi:MAG TPA: hypothetical protein VL171_16385 [Verrucomicrobiae bacterium]|nr:hypothetical protein [Verrucomicrobiae bacterium]